MPYDVTAAILVLQNNEMLVNEMKNNEKHVGVPNQSCRSSTLFLSFYILFCSNKFGTGSP